MAYNKAKEEKKWRLWKEAEEKQLRSLGVNEDDIEKLRRTCREERLAEVVGVSIVHREKDQVEKAHLHQPESEEGGIRLDADGVVEVAIARPQHHKRDAGQ